MVRVGSLDILYILHTFLHSERKEVIDRGLAGAWVFPAVFESQLFEILKSDAMFGVSRRRLFKFPPRLFHFLRDEKKMRVGGKNKIYLSI